MLNSVTEILNKLPFDAISKKELYYHPLCDVYFPGICGDLGVAIKDEKLLSCAVTYSGGDHAVVIYDVTNFGEIKMKNSYRGDGQITHQIDPAATHHEPQMGTFISFKLVTNLNSTGPSDIFVTLREMEFDQNDAQEAVQNHPNDFQAAVTYCYEKQKQYRSV